MKRPVVALLHLTLALLAAPLAADAQPAGKVYRIGYLATRATTPPYFDPFRDALREQGWIEGQNIVFEWRIAEGKSERLPDLAADLARLKVDVIVASPGGPTVEAAKAATSTIPIVMVASHDAVATGLVTSLARPGGNITGTDSMAPDLDAKRLELLKEFSPRAFRASVLYNPNYPPTGVHLRHTQVAARSLGITLIPLEVRDVGQLEVAFAAMTKDRPDALLVFTDSFIFAQLKRVVDFAAEQRIPAIYEFKEFAAAGGLITFGANLKDLFRRAGTYVGKILKGAKPADLPVEQPTKFELVINLKTAKALGLTIPQSVLLRADEVIQ